MSGYLGSGELFLDRLTDAGVATGYTLVGNATSFEIKANSETKTRKSMGASTYGQALDTVTIQQPADITIELDDIDRETMAMILFGSAATLTQGSGSIAAEAMTTIHNKYVQLTKGRLTTGTVVVKDVTDATTYSGTTDYTVDLELGMIKVLSTGTIANSAVLHVSADYTAIAGYTISGSTTPTIKAKMLLKGVNRVDGSKNYVYVDEALLTPDSGLNFLSEDFNKITFKGVMNTLSGQTAPFRVQLRD